MKKLIIFCLMAVVSLTVYSQKLEYNAFQSNIVQAYGMTIKEQGKLTSAECSLTIICDEHISIYGKGENGQIHFKFTDIYGMTVKTDDEDEVWVQLYSSTNHDEPYAELNISAEKVLALLDGKDGGIYDECKQIIFKINGSSEKKRQNIEAFKELRQYIFSYRGKTKIENWND